MNERITDFEVEQLLLGELPEHRAQGVRAQLEADEDPRLSELPRSNAAVLRDYPAETVARRIQARIDALEPEPARGIRWPLWGTATALAVAAAAVLVWGLRQDGTSAPASETRIAQAPDRGTERIKGDAAIVLQRQQGTRAENLLAGATVSEGDTIQVSYRSGGWTHGVLVSLDGAGEVTLHFPETQGASTELRAQATLHAFELDDAPDYEHFYFFTDTQPLDVAAVMDRVRGRPSLTNNPAPAAAVTELPLTRLVGP